MALVNHAKKEINAKIVYYGPEKAGKATSLRYVYERIKQSLRGELKTLPASGSSLLYFDFSPFEQTVFGGYRIRLHIYTLQGKVANPAAWKMTLKGADGLVIVADASMPEQPRSCESVLQLRDFLGSYGVGLSDIPFVLQLNKKDLYEQESVADIVSTVGLPDCSCFMTAANKGEGVLETLTQLSGMVMDRIGKREDLLQAGTKVADKNIVNAAESETLSNPSDEPLPSLLNTVDEPDGSVTPLSLVSRELIAPKISLAEEGLDITGTTVRIPLDISEGGGRQRIVVTVTVSV